MDAAKNPLNIVILDACRNNPFARSFRVSTSGLAQMDAPAGTFIAFATAPGSIASDGAGDNGIYTKHLLQHMRTPGLTIEHVFKQVRISVMAETKGEQVPWESSSLRGDFAFRAGPHQPGVAAAIAEALRIEREASQAQTEKLIADALERQRKQLEGQGLAVAAATQVPGKPTVTTPAAPPPQVVASAPPSAAAIADSSLPSVGDRWTYRVSPTRGSTSPLGRNHVVSVVAASRDVVLDAVAVDGMKPKEWAHVRGAYVVGQGASVFSPYLNTFARLSRNAALGSVAMHETACASPYTCTARATVVGTETVTVPAGRFDAVKVVVEHLWSPFSMVSTLGSGGADMTGGRILTVWYSPKVKRAIKYSSRLQAGMYPPLEANFDLELVSYEVR